MTLSALASSRLEREAKLEHALAKCDVLAQSLRDVLKLFDPKQHLNAAAQEVLRRAKAELVESSR